ncbi:MAG: SulP family inorganic anion transporter [Bryobacterales bacterium]|nr:SulP family inorganic anion transporter [Bryobacterales bacterium]
MKETTGATRTGFPPGRDVLASVVVFLVALPLCMGVAIASGVPPAAGLITGIVGGILVGFIGGAPLQVSGPAAGLTVLVWELVQSHGLALLGTVVLVAGLMQLIAGLCKTGQWFRAISPSVIHGMLAGIGVLIFASQFHIMVDDKPRGSGLANLLSIPESVYKGIFPMDGASHHVAALLGAITIVTMIAWERFRPKRLANLPGPLLAILLVSAIAMLLKLDVNYVKVPNALVESFLYPSMETLRQVFTKEMLGAAAALAFIASAETLLSTAAVDQMHRGPRASYDRELAAQGIGNILCGFVGALPMTGVIVRSSANVTSGAATKWSAIMHGFWLLGTIVLLPDVLRLIPTSGLAAILVYTGFKLFNPSRVRLLARFGRGEVAVFLVTLLGIVGTDLLTGVLLGVILAVGKLLYTFTHLTVRCVPCEAERRVDLFLEGAATFVGLPNLARELDSVPAGRMVHLHFEKLNYIDHACLELIHNWRKQHEELGSSLVVQWEDLEERYRAPLGGRPVDAHSKLISQAETVGSGH